MKICEVTGDFSRVKVIMYNVKGDKAVFHWKNIRPMIDNIWVGEGEPDEYGNVYYKVYAKWPDVDAALYFNETNEWRTAEELLEWFDREYLLTKEEFIYGMRRRVEGTSWIKLTEVEMIKLVAPELLGAAMEVRDRIKTVRDRKHAEMAKQRQEEDEKFVKESNEISESILVKAIDRIKDGGVVKNDEITFWKDRYDHKKVSVITELMDRYKISVPIRTRGWIMNRLNSVTIKDGNVVGCNWQKSGRAVVSDKFWDYMDQLVKAVTANAESA